MKAAHQRGASMHLFIETFLNEMKNSGDPSASLRKTQLETPPLLEQEHIPEYKIKEGRNLFYKFYDSDYVSDYEKILGTEIKIYSPFLFYRGAIDWLITIRPWGIGVRDFKGSNNFIKKGSRKEEGYKYQLGGYAVALEDMYKKEKENIKVNYASIINVQVNSNRVQNIECAGDELKEYNTVLNIGKIPTDNLYYLYQKHTFTLMKYCCQY